MPTWSTIVQPYGEYVSEPFDISNTLDRYVIETKIEEINVHGQTLEFYFSVSNDLINWSEWKPFYEQSSDILNEYLLFQLYFRYKVVIASTDHSERPYFQSIEMNFIPYTLFDNFGDLSLKPKLWITKRNGNGNIKLVNHMTGQQMTFKDIRNNEELYIDCENEELISSLQQSIGMYRYDDHNDEWLELDIGESYLKGYGDFDMNIRYQSRLLQD